MRGKARPRGADKSAYPSQGSRATQCPDRTCRSSRDSTPPYPRSAFHSLVTTPARAGGRLPRRLSPRPERRSARADRTGARRRCGRRGPPLVVMRSPKRPAPAALASGASPRAATATATAVPSFPYLPRIKVNGGASRRNQHPRRRQRRTPRRQSTFNLSDLPALRLFATAIEGWTVANPSQSVRRGHHKDDRANDSRREDGGKEGPRQEIGEGGPR